MTGDALESFEGPRTLQYFRVLLIIAICLFAIGVVLSQLYGFTLLENFMRLFVENPMILLELAGIIALFVLMVSVGRTILQYVE